MRCWGRSGENVPKPPSHFLKSSVFYYVQNKVPWPAAVMKESLRLLHRTCNCEAKSCEHSLPIISRLRSHYGGERLPRILPERAMKLRNHGHASDWIMGKRKTFSTRRLGVPRSWKAAVVQQFLNRYCSFIKMRKPSMQKKKMHGISN